MSILNKSYFYDEKSAFNYLESIIWRNGIICPHCKIIDKSHELQGSSTRMGCRKCNVCKKQFTVTIGTIFERSHIPLYKWLQGAYLMASSKKGISSHQLHRTLEITYKSAWFMAHRLREAMKDSDSDGSVGGIGKLVEIDETYVGGYMEGGKGGKGKDIVMSILERKGKIVSEIIPNKKWYIITPLITKHVKKGSIINTDSLIGYKDLDRRGYKHEQMNHSKEEYVRGNYHTNSVEGFFGLFKRGMTGIYQHCSSKHLNKYLVEFDFRYNYRNISDIERFDKILSFIIGKRLFLK